MKSAHFNITNMQKVLSVSMSCLKVYKEQEANGPHQFVVSFYIIFSVFKYLCFRLNLLSCGPSICLRSSYKKIRSTLSKNASIIIVAL